jgi:tRNA threonylcarbamoyladenosine biosynthesis protein TsaE
MEVSTHSTQETRKLAFKVAKKIAKGDIIALYGDLGTGKTAFTKYLAEALGFKSRVQSPTFVIARRYKSGNLVLNHIDLYRLASKQDAEDIGIEDFLRNPENITVIEWPEVIEELLPRKTTRIYFKYIGENERKIKIQNLH